MLGETFNISHANTGNFHGRIQNFSQEAAKMQTLVRGINTFLGAGKPCEAAYS